MPTETAAVEAPACSSWASSSSSATRQPSVVPSESSRTSGLATRDRLLERALVTVDHPLAREVLSLVCSSGGAHALRELAIRCEREERASDGGAVARRDEIARL